MLAYRIDPGCETFFLDLANEWPAGRANDRRIKRPAEASRREHVLQSLVRCDRALGFPNREIPLRVSQSFELTAQL